MARARAVPRVVTEARDRAVDGGVGHVVGTDAEPRRDAGPEALEHDVGARAERLREAGVVREVADDRLGARAKRGVPRGRGRAHRVAARRLDPDDARAEPPELATRVRAGEEAREVDDERVRRAVARGRSVPLSSRSLTDRSIAQADKRKRILDAAIRVFAEHGYHGARVGDIAEDAGVAHGLLYHYFASKDDVLRTIFVENWGELIARFRAVEASDEPAAEKLEGIAKILLRTWRNDPALVTVMVREVARSQQLQEQVDEVREAFAIVQRVIEEGQATGAFRRGRRRTPGELDLLRRARGGAHGLGARPASGQRGRRRARRADGDRARAARARGLGSRAVKVFNLNGDEWDRVEERPGWRSKDAWVGARIGAELIGGSMYELEPGDRLWPYHTHHANEEWLIVLRGRPTLRTPEGEQELDEGDVVVLPARQGGRSPGLERHRRRRFACSCSRRCSRPTSSSTRTAARFGASTRRASGSSEPFRGPDAEYWEGE